MHWITLAAVPHLPAGATVITTASVSPASRASWAAQASRSKSRPSKSCWPRRRAAISPAKSMAWPAVQGSP